MARVWAHTAPQGWCESAGPGTVPTGQGLQSRSDSIGRDLTTWMSPVAPGVPSGTKRALNYVVVGLNLAVGTRQVSTSAHIPAKHRGVSSALVLRLMLVDDTWRW